MGVTGDKSEDGQVGCVGVDLAKGRDLNTIHVRYETHPFLADDSNILQGSFEVRHPTIKECSEGVGRVRYTFTTNDLTAITQEPCDVVAIQSDEFGVNTLATVEEVEYHYPTITIRASRFVSPYDSP